MGEDIAALAGLVIAFVFVALAAYTGDTRYDAAGSIAIGIVLITVAFFIAVRIRALLIGKSAEPALERSIILCIEQDPAIVELLNTITLQFGPKILLAVKIRMQPHLNIEQAVAHINDMEAEIKRRHPEVGWCFVEPDITD
jgi:divalent metal cation (Fe/Co/Zn/Cd) transporter